MTANVAPSPLKLTAARLENTIGLRSLRRASPPKSDDYRWLDTPEGHRLRVHDLGGGPFTLVFVPDPPNVLAHHRASFERLAKSFRVIGIELPGFGFSRPRRSFGYSLSESAAAVTSALRQLDAKQCILCLSCVAGLASVVAAARHPDLVAGVAAIQTPDLPAALAWSERVDKQRIARTPVLGQLVVRATRRELADQWYRAAAGSPEAATLLTQTALEAYARGAVYGLSTALQQLPHVNDDDLAVTEHVPAIAMWGNRDRTHRRTDRRGLQRYLPRLQVAEFDQAGHFPDLETPEEFRDVLIDWVMREVA